jgi:uncharacterized membrane protein
MKNFRYALIILILPAVMLFADNGWNAEFSKNGITVYTRAVAGSDIKEFKGIGIIDAPVEVVNNVLDDIPNLANWMPDCLVSKIAEKKSDDYMILYQVIKTPWPLNSRDFTFETKIIKEKDKIIRTVKAVPHSSFPPTGNYVRITNMTGQWTLLRQDNNTRTLATYQIKTDPAGNIPVAIANSTSKKLPYETLLRLKEQVKNSKYRK